MTRNGRERHNKAGLDTQVKNEEGKSIASALNGGREISQTVIYVGDLVQSVGETELRKLTTNVKSIKILHDKNKPGFNYAFVEYIDHTSAENGLQALSGISIGDTQIKSNWAYQSVAQIEENTKLYSIFVGDLSAEIDDETLMKAFAHFKSVESAHVMWDMQTSRSRGYGFVQFSEISEAEKALKTMNGEKIRGRVIRCNWAQHKQDTTKKRRNKSNQLMITTPAIQMPYKYMNEVGNYLETDNFNTDNDDNGNSNEFSPKTAKNNIINSEKNNSKMKNNNDNDNDNDNVDNNDNNKIRNTKKIHNHGLNINGTKAYSNFNIEFNNYINNYNYMEQDYMGANIGRDDMNVSSSAPLMMQIMQPISYDMILRQTPSWHTTVYIGNIAHFTQQQDLFPFLSNFGYIMDFKFHPEKGCAFVKYDSHQRAALAIVQLFGFVFNGRPLRCGWGKDRPHNKMYR